MPNQHHWKGGKDAWGTVTSWQWLNLSSSNNCDYCLHWWAWSWFKSARQTVLPLASRACRNPHPPQQCTESLGVPGTASTPNHTQILLEIQYMKSLLQSAARSHLGSTVMQCQAMANALGKCFVFRSAGASWVSQEEWFCLRFLRMVDSLVTCFISTCEKLRLGIVRPSFFTLSWERKVGFFMVMYFEIVLTWKSFISLSL